MTRAHALCLALLAGCGSVPADGDGGGSADASFDAPLNGFVDVTVFDPRTPGTALRDVDVVFHNPDLSVAATLATDVSGHVRGSVTRGGAVSVALVAGTDSYEVYTWFGVNPGDNLQVGVATAPDPSDVGSATINLPTFGQPATVDRYVTDVGCNSNWDSVPTPGGPPVTNPITLVLGPDCRHPSNTYNVLAIAGVQATDEALAYAVATGIPVGTAANLTTWRTDWRMFDLSLTNAPADIGVDANVGVGAIPVANGIQFDGINNEAVLSSPGAGVSFALKYPKSLGDAIDYGTGIFFPNGEISFYLKRETGNPTAATINLTTDLVPRANDPAIADGIATWTLTEGVMPDGMYLAASYTTPGATTRRTKWIMSLPPRMTSVTLPPLPPSLSLWSWDATSTFGPLSIRQFETTQMDGYDGFRRDVFMTFLDNQDFMQKFAVGDGLYRFTFSLRLR